MALARSGPVRPGRTASWTSAPVSRHARGEHDVESGTMNGVPHASTSRHRRRSSPASTRRVIVIAVVRSVVHLFQQIGVTDRTQAAAWAKRHLLALDRG